MPSIFGNLALKATPERQRALITPGHLYRLLSTEFRQRRPARCGCRMPMIGFREPGRSGTANWGLEPPRKGCTHCEGLVARLVSQYSSLYDVTNP
jgi:hypothetical protein